MNWRNIIKILTWLLIYFVVIHTNIREYLFESTIIKSWSLYICFKFIEMIIDIRALRWDFFCCNYVCDEVFVLEPVLNLVVWIAFSFIATKIYSKTYFKSWVNRYRTADSCTFVIISTNNRNIQTLILLKYCITIREISWILTHSYFIICYDFITS